MSEKLTVNQLRVLRRLSAGPYYPAGRDIISARTLERKGLATFYRKYLSYEITVAGRDLIASSIWEEPK